jgi:hypothetical protein
MSHRPAISDTTQDDMMTPERREHVQRAQPEAAATFQRWEVLACELRHLPWVLHRLRLLMLFMMDRAVMRWRSVDQAVTWAWIPTRRWIAGLLVPDGFMAVVWTATCLPHVLLVLALPLVVWPVFGVGTTHAASPPPFQPAEVWAVEAAFREAVQLWADEQFEALWERGLLSSRYRVSREAFIRGMRHRVVKPTCCWGRLGAVRVYPQATDEALVEAQVGVDVKTLGTTVVRSMLVYLRREDGVWRVTLEDFLTRPEDALSGLRGLW